jgi:hypothetical protein
VIERSGRFQVEGVPGVSVFPDNRIPGGFYALPESPRLATDGQNHPQMKLILYGKRMHLRFQVTGGILACTTSLGLYEAERALLASAVQAKLAREHPGTGLTWLQTTWLKGRCDLRLTKDLQLTGEPSLFGDNWCVFQSSLDEGAARQLEQAWADGLPDSHIQYKLTAQAPPSDFIFEGKLVTNVQELPPLIVRVDLP